MFLHSTTCHNLQSASKDFQLVYLLVLRTSNLVFFWTFLHLGLRKIAQTCQYNIKLRSCFSSKKGQVIFGKLLEYLVSLKEGHHFIRLWQVR